MHNTHFSRWQQWGPRWGQSTWHLVDITKLVQPLRTEPKGVLRRFLGGAVDGRDVAKQLPSSPSSSSMSIARESLLLTALS